MERPRTIGRSGLAAIAPVALSIACASHSQDLPPLGEALVVVDTDVPIPAFASRLRLDLYTSDGSTWYESRDIARRDPRDWPASFSVYTPDTERTALVRLRIYPEGKLRDYHGERFVSRQPTGAPGEPAAPIPSCDAPPSCELPRLVKGGVDVTPRSEPQPFLTIDRLLRVRLTPGVRGRVHVVLRGDCFATMANLAGQQTCVDAAAAFGPVEDASLEADMTVPPAVAKRFGGGVPCPPGASPRPGRTRPDGRRMFDEEVCVPGGTFVFGNTDEVGTGESAGVPEHQAVVPPFTMDRYEVTVSRWREFTRPPTKATANADKLERDTCKQVLPSNKRWCTWSESAKVPEDREDYAITCVTWSAARAFCQSLGGDLPTEVQWEWVAQHVSRPRRTDYPWGNEPATCVGPNGGEDRVIGDRLWGCSTRVRFGESCVTGTGIDCGGTGLELCNTEKIAINPRQGPQPVDAVDRPTGDRSLGLGVVNMAGGVAEFTRDAFHALDSNCWAVAPLVSPVCVDEGAKRHSVRGGSWVAGGAGGLGGSRHANESGPLSPYGPAQVGFRCVRPVEVP